MERKDTIEELFKQKLANHQVSVNPELWAVASKIPATTSVITSGGISILSKAIIGISAVASVIGIGYLVSEKYTTTENKLIKIEEKTRNTKTPLKKINTKLSTNQPSSLYTEKVNNTLFFSSSKKTNPLNTLDKDLNTESKSIQEGSINSIINKTSIENSTISTGENIQSDHRELGNSEPVLHSGTNSNLTQGEKRPENKFNIESNLIVTLPNIFTPNGDGNNDVFKLNTTEINDFSIVILNSMGAVVYQSNDASFEWNGTLPTGDPVEEGNFIYYITGKDKEGKFVSKHSRLVIKH